MIYLALSVPNQTLEYSLLLQHPSSTTNNVQITRDTTQNHNLFSCSYSPHVFFFHRLNPVQKYSWHFHFLLTFLFSTPCFFKTLTPETHLNLYVYLYMRRIGTSLSCFLGFSLLFSSSFICWDFESSSSSLINQEFCY